MTSVFRVEFYLGKKGKSVSSVNAVYIRSVYNKWKKKCCTEL